MITESKILHDNIKNFRQILNEGVGNTEIINAIQNHEWLYIYYDAKSEKGENATGYRTIRPYVLGTNKNGHTMLRAWQDNPKNSWHFTNRETRDDSKYHDYWVDAEGMKPGWRMFRVDKISNIYPIGKKFDDENGLPMIPAGYHEGGDDDMTSIIAYVSTKKEPDFQYKYDKEIEPELISKADQTKAKWDSIRKGNINNRKITADDVLKLRDIASRVHKKAHGNYLVVIDDRNNYQLIQAKDKQKQNIPDTAIVGSLPYLYDVMVKQNTPVDTRFFDDMRNKSNKAGIKETKKSTIPYKKMTFFK